MRGKTEGVYCSRKLLMMLADLPGILS